MEIQPTNYPLAEVTFSQNTLEEITRLRGEVRFVRLLEYLEQQDNVPPDVAHELSTAIREINEIMTLNPNPSGDMITDLTRTARDIHLSRLLRERGIMRLYYVLNNKDPETGLPMYMRMHDPDTGEPFTTRERAVRWFCANANVSRATIFNRFSVIDRLLELGLDMGEIYQILLEKPNAIQQILNSLATWNRQHIQALPSAVVERVADLYAPEIKEDLQRAETTEEVVHLIRPAIQNLVREVAHIPSAREAVQFVEEDVALHPRINYMWDTETDRLLVSFTVMVKRDDGTEYIGDVIRIPFVPDYPAHVPDPIREDMVQKLKARVK